MQKRVAKVSETAEKHLAPLESNAWADFLPLVEHLAVIRWDDGTARTPGTLTFRTVGTDFQIIAREPDAGLMLSVRAENLDDCLFALSAALGAEDAPWQEDPYATPRKPKGKKGG